MIIFDHLILAKLSIVVHFNLKSVAFGTFAIKDITDKTGEI
jgi:hypothetical protein